MSIFSIFRPRRKAASIAKERLQIVVSHRTKQRDTDFLPKLHNELVAVISKYVNINPEQIKVELGQTQDCSVLELNVTLPNEVTGKTDKPSDKSSDKKPEAQSKKDKNTQKKQSKETADA